MSNITMKFSRPKGISKKDIHEKIALDINKQLNRKQLKGFIGEKHPIAKEHIQFWIEDFCLKKKYILKGDKLRRDYWLFLERLYTNIMQKFIRKDTLTKDTDDDIQENVYYYPGLVYLKGKGYIITNSEKLIEKYEEQRTDSLDGQRIHLDQKCHDASNFIKQLPEHQRELLDNKKDSEIT